MIDSTLDDFEQLLRLTPDMLTAVGADIAGPQAPRKRLIEHIRSDAAADALFARACRFEPPYDATWVHQPGTAYPYLSLELASEAYGPEQFRAFLSGIVLADSTAIPYDYRALAAEFLVDVGPGHFLDELRRVVETTEPPRSRPLATKIETRSDGIDHLFDIPSTQEGRLQLIAAASLIKTRESIALLAGRVLERVERRRVQPAGDAPVPRGMVSLEAERLIAEDIANTLVSPSDYLVMWDQELAAPAEGAMPLTIAELLRITLLSGEFKLPDATVRPVLVAFYRSVLRISGRAIIGLSGGVFYVEHGVDATPSFFYMGRDAVIGKGCTIDCVGGAVLQQGAFLGGGFMPILVHTHKHIRKAGEPGVAERKQVLPAIFVAEAGARLPMSAIGIFETADFINQDASPYEGIRALAPTPQDK